MSMNPPEKSISRPAWIDDTTEVIIVQPDGSSEPRRLSTPQAASELQHLIAEKVRLGELALDAVVIFLSARD